MKYAYDLDKLRENLKTFLEQNSYESPGYWAHRMNISHQTIYNLIHKSNSPHRKIVYRVGSFLEKFKKEEPVNVHIKLDKNHEPHITIEEKNGSRE